MRSVMLKQTSLLIIVLTYVVTAYEPILDGSADPVRVNAYFGVIFSFLFFISCGIVYYYAEKDFPKVTYVTLSLGYYCSFGILLLVPIDVASCIIDRRSTDPSYITIYNTHVNKISMSYNIFFTIILIMNSFVLVFEEYINTDGYFTVIGRIASSFYRMFVDTILGIVAGFIVLAILIGQKVMPADQSALLLASVIVTNTVYETFLMFLLAYGLVEYPRSIWNMGDLEYYLLKTQMQATSDYNDISESRIDVSLEVASVLKTEQEVAGYGSPALSDAMAILKADCEAEFTSDKEGVVARNKSGQISIHTLAALRTKLNSMKDRYRMAKAKVSATRLLAYRLEDLIEAKKRNDGVRKVKWSLTGKESTEAEYNWLIVYRPVLYKLLALFFAACSVLSFLGVICSMEGVDTTVSVYFTVVHDVSSTPGGIAVFVLLSLSYAMYVSFWSLFQIRLAGMMVLIPWTTTPEALSFNVRMIGRLAAPLAFFYLGWLSENGLRDGQWTVSNIRSDAVYGNATTLEAFTYDSGGVSTVFYKNVTSTVLLSGADSKPLMGSSFSNFYQLQKVGAIQKTFGTFFPVLLIVLLALLATNTANRFLVLIGKPKWQFGAEIPNEEALKEGKRNLSRDKNKVASAMHRELNKQARDDMMKNKGDGGGPTFEFFSKAKKKESGKFEAAKLAEPDLLNGNIERKMAAKLMGSGWKEFYACVRHPGELQFYKDEAAATSFDKTAASTIDLEVVSSFEIREKPGNSKGAVYLDIQLMESQFNLRMHSPEEAERWRDLLVKWKDYKTEYKRLGIGRKEGDDEDIETGPPKSAAELGADLDALDIVEDVELTGGGEYKPKDEKKSSGSGGWGGFFGGGAKKGSGGSTLNSSNASTAETAAQLNIKPANIEGWLERKMSGGGFHIGNEWHRRYARIDEKNGTFVYFKSSSAGENPNGSIDLKTLVSVGFYDKGGSFDKSRFNMVTGDDKTYKWKSNSEADGKKWVRAINDWKDYLILSTSEKV